MTLARYGDDIAYDTDKTAIYVVRQPSRGRSLRNRTGSKDVRLMITAHSTSKA